MTPLKALELVKRYSQLSRLIKDCKKRIGESLDCCTGIDGNRNKLNEDGFLMCAPNLDGKGRDRNLHLHDWYLPQFDSPYGRAHYLEVDEDCKAECEHCYAAHLAIQERKNARIELGRVKAAMSRSNQPIRSAVLPEGLRSELAK